MAHWYSDNSQSNGNTPLVKLSRVTEGAPVTMLAKIEGRNPAYSVKCAIRTGMRPEHAGKTVVAPPADSGGRYLCSTLFEGLFDTQGIAA
jgi:cysteine synthase A